MKVRELIEKLQKFEPDMLVVKEYDFGWSCRDIEVCEDVVVSNPEYNNYHTVFHPHDVCNDNCDEYCDGNVNNRDDVIRVVCLQR